jgi:LacI family transcriptional regulator
MAKITITELAQRLGVSACTVNKALTGKPKVSEATRERIVAEARRLGYRPNRAAQVLARRPVRMAYVRPKHFESFFAPFEAGLRAGVQRLTDHRISMTFRALPPHRWPGQLLAAVRQWVRSGLSGLVLSPMSGVEYAPVWDLLAEHRIPLVQLGLEVSGAPAALTVRQDTFLSGTLAAELLSHFPGPAAMMIGNRRVVDHAEKLQAFEAEATRRGLAIAAVVEHQDDPRLAYTLTRRLFDEHPGVRGLYVATDNIGGVLCGMRRSAPAGQVKIVATGLFPEIRQAMDEGLVHFSLDQRMAEQGELAVQQLHERLSHSAGAPQRILVPPLVALRGNIERLGAQWEP